MVELVWAASETTGRCGQVTGTWCDRVSSLAFGARKATATIKGPPLVMFAFLKDSVAGGMVKGAPCRTRNPPRRLSQCSSCDTGFRKMAGEM